MSRAQLRVLRVNELTVHAWDLARAIRVDDQLDSNLAQWIYDHLSPLRDAIALSGFATPVQPSEDAAPETRLLHLVGRRP